jgi:hypothetical protein
MSSLSGVSGIGVLREGPLHAAVKVLSAAPGDRLEVPVGRFVIDGVRVDEHGEVVSIRRSAKHGSVVDVFDKLTAFRRYPAPFSTRELASVLGCTMLLAQRTAYCLRAINIIEAADRRGRTPLHRRLASEAWPPA